MAGWGMQKDYAHALQLARPLADAGNAWACFVMVSGSIGNARLWTDMCSVTWAPSGLGICLLFRLLFAVFFYKNGF